MPLPRSSDSSQPEPGRLIITGDADNSSPSLHPHYKGFPATTRRSALLPRIRTQLLTVTAAWRSPSHQPYQPGQQHRGEEFLRSVSEPGPGSRRLNTGHQQSSTQVALCLIPRKPPVPGFDVVYAFRCVIDGSLSFAFPAHTCHILCDVSVSLTTTTHSPQQHTVVWDLLLQSDPEGPTFISDTALTTRQSSLYIKDLPVPIRSTR
jgi:hypothetical protein